MTLRSLLAALALACLAGAAAPLAAQTTGAISGSVRDRSSRLPIHRAQILVDGHLATLTDTAGVYRTSHVSFAPGALVVSAGYAF